MNVERVELVPRPIVGLNEVVQMSELETFFGSAFAAVAAELAAQGIRPAGPAVSLYREVTRDKVAVTVGFPVNEATTPAGDLVCETLPGGPAVTTIHAGPYDGLQKTYGELTGWLVGQGLTPASAMWEEYLVGPADDPEPARWRTRIVYPLQEPLVPAGITHGAGRRPRT